MTEILATLFGKLEKIQGDQWPTQSSLEIKIAVLMVDESMVCLVWVGQSHKEISRAASCHEPKIFGGI